MGRPKSDMPTDAEFDILLTLWKRGTATVRDIDDDFKAMGRNLAYTSIATIARIMVTKGYAEIVDKRRPQKFKATINEKACRLAALKSMINRHFAGNLERAIVSLQELAKQSEAA